MFEFIDLFLNDAKTFVFSITALLILFVFVMLGRLEYKK